MPYDSNGNASLVPGYLAVEGQTILPSQHNPPLEDIASMLSQVVLRSGVAPMSGNLNYSGFKPINIGTATSGGDAVPLSQLQLLLAGLATVPTGTVMGFRRTSAPNGWVKENGGTIGNASSGATTRANEDTEALFTHLWTEFSNTVLPIQDSAGAASTRGASAAADFAANKRMPLFDSRSRFLRGADDGLGFDAAITVGAAQSDEIKSHTHTGTTGSGGPSDPQVRVNASATAVTTTVADTLMLLSVSVGNWFSNTLRNLTHTHSFTTDATGGTETRPRASAVLYCIKL